MKKHFSARHCLAMFCAAGILMAAGCGQNPNAELSGQDVAVLEEHTGSSDLDSEDGQATADASQKEPFEIDLATAGAEMTAKAVEDDKTEKPDGEDTSDAQETAAEETTTTPDYSSLVTGTMYSMDFLNLRAAADTDSEVIGHLNPEESIGIIERVDERWIKAVYDGQLCYVAGEYLTEDPDWKSKLSSSAGYEDGAAVGLDPSWRFADYSAIHSGHAVMYLASRNRKNITIGVNAGHGTKGGTEVKTWCHPDQTPKVTGGTTGAGAAKAVAVSTGMNFKDGTPEASVTLQMARILKDMLLENGYDVLMIRDGEDVQLDNVARTVICNNAADCHIALHWDSDGLDYDKGCFYMSVPDGIKYFEPVASTWEKDEKLGNSLIRGLKERGLKIFGDGTMDMDLTQTSYSSVPSVDIELGNQYSDHGSDALYERGYGLLQGINYFFGFE